MTTINLTPTQHAIPAKTINTSSGKVDWFPDNIRGDACKKVLDGMLNHALITNNDTSWFVVTKGYDALDMKHPDVTPSMPEVDAELEHTVVTAEAMWAPASVQTKLHIHDNSKQAEVIQMLQRPKGVTIGQIYTATGWQAHAMRGILTGAFRRKLGLAIVSDKPQGGERVYRIA